MCAQAFESAPLQQSLRYLHLSFVQSEFVPVNNKIRINLVLCDLYSEAKGAINRDAIIASKLSTMHVQINERIKEFMIV